MIPEKITSNWLTMAVMSNTKCLFKEKDDLIEWIYNNIDYFRDYVDYNSDKQQLTIRNFPIMIGVQEHCYYNESSYKDHDIDLSHYPYNKLSALILKFSSTPRKHLVIDSSIYFKDKDTENEHESPF